jgi:hypothetical protein
MSDDLYIDGNKVFETKQDHQSYLEPISGIYLNALCKDVHASSYNAGWWHDPETKEELINNIYVLATKIGLIHSEASEALEGLRKNIPDDKLPQYPMDAVEIADVIIRAFDYCGARGYNIGTIIAEKMAINHSRADHKIENRMVKEGGKYF